MMVRGSQAWMMVGLALAGGLQENTPGASARCGDCLARLEQAGGEEEETAAQDGAASSRKM